jgi:hypothetical protein
VLFFKAGDAGFEPTTFGSGEALKMQEIQLTRNLHVAD